MISRAVTGLHPARRDRAAFTLTELLVVLGIAALLVLLQASAIAHSQASSDRAVCANNLHRLMQAWQMYADDYSGALMANQASVPNYLNWVRGLMDFSSGNPDNVNLAYLTNAQYAAMGSYVKSPAVFRCPANLSTVIRAAAPRTWQRTTPTR